MPFLKTNDPSTSTIDSNIKEPISKRYLREISGRDVIKESIENIILTMNGELLFNHGFGTSVLMEVFSNFSGASTDSIKTSIIKAVRRWEPRVILNDNGVVVKVDEDNNSFSLSLEYTIIQSGQTDILNRTISI